MGTRREKKLVSRKVVAVVFGLNRCWALPINSVIDLTLQFGHDLLYFNYLLVLKILVLPRG